MSYSALSVLWCVQSTDYRKRRQLVAGFYDENRVVIHDLQTGEQKVMEAKQPLKIAISPNHIAVTTDEDELRLFSNDGELVHAIPDSIAASCVAFHPRNPNILAIGFDDGSVVM